MSGTSSSSNCLPPNTVLQPCPRTVTQLWPCLHFSRLPLKISPEMVHIRRDIFSLVPNWVFYSTHKTTGLSEIYSHNLIITLLFSIFSTFWNHHHILIPEHFSSPQKETVAVDSHFPFLSCFSLTQPLNTELISVLMDLNVWTLESQPVTVSFWFLLCNIMFSRCTHVLACIITSFLFMAR